MLNLLPDKHKVFIQKNKFITALNKEQTDILRLDVIDPVVSGNKFFKLQLAIKEAIQNKHTTIATFGGAYSNHIVATACLCSKLGLKSMGIIRGEQPAQLSNTLIHAQSFGMHLIFVSRDLFSNKEQLMANHSSKGYYWIAEGGYSRLGAEGAKDICHWIDETYTDIVCAVGTGTMMAGLIAGCFPHQKVTGISVLKGYSNLISDVERLLTQDEKEKSYTVLHDYHFGGYAKHTPALINWMNKFYTEQNTPTDIVYTGKLCFAVENLLNNHYFESQSKIMIIHSGGLQGNTSLPYGTLLYK